MRTAIVTDSNSGIHADTAAAMRISIVPMPVLINGEQYYEGKDIGDAAFWNALSSNVEVTTSMPSPRDVMDIWDHLLQDEGYDEVLYIPMSSGLSSSYEAARCLSAEYGSRVVVADARRISVTLYSTVMEAVRLSQLGKSAAEIAAITEKNAQNSSIYLAVDDINFLNRGGRISKSTAVVGSMFHVKPVLTIHGGRIEPLTKVQGMKSAVKVMLRMIQQDIENRFGNNPSSVNIGVAVSDRTDTELRFLLNQLEGAFPTATTFAARLPYSICVHTGPGAIGYGISYIDEGVI